MISIDRQLTDLTLSHPTPPRKNVTMHMTGRSIGVGVVLTSEKISLKKGSKDELSNKPVLNSVGDKTREKTSIGSRDVIRQG